MKKKTTGTNIILLVLATKSADASRIAIDIASYLYIHIKPIK